MLTILWIIASEMDIKGIVHIPNLMQAIGKLVCVYLLQFVRY